MATKKSSKKPRAKRPAPKVVKKPDEAVQVEPQPSQNEARMRAERCNAELSAVLERYRCVIQPYIIPVLDPVGQMGDCAQISASYGIRALP